MNFVTSVRVDLLTGRGQTESGATQPDLKGSATFVTSLYDIGRASWLSFKRSFSSYLRRFRYFLALDIQLVIFGESDLKLFVQQYRKLTDDSGHCENSLATFSGKARIGRRDRDNADAGAASPATSPMTCATREGEVKPSSSGTQFVTLPFQQLPAYQHRARVQHVLKSAEFSEDNHKLLHGHPEALHADYVIMMNSKAALVQQVAKYNPFNSTHFFWVDAGYAAHPTDDEDCVIEDSDVAAVNGNHLNSDGWAETPMTVVIPPGTRWSPTPLLSSTSTLTYIRLNDPRLYANLTQLHKRRIAPALAGGFFGGTQKMVTYYERLYNKCFLSRLSEGTVSEDQTVALDAYFEQPGIFNLVEGDWFDAYRLFN